jgi:hypothetical protein
MIKGTIEVSKTDTSYCTILIGAPNGIPLSQYTKATAAPLWWLGNFEPGLTRRNDY